MNDDLRNYVAQQRRWRRPRAGAQGRIWRRGQRRQPPPSTPIARCVQDMLQQRRAYACAQMQADSLVSVGQWIGLLLGVILTFSVFGGLAFMGAVSRSLPPPTPQAVVQEQTRIIDNSLAGAGNALPSVVLGTIFNNVVISRSLNMIVMTNQTKDRYECHSPNDLWVLDPYAGVRVPGDYAMPTACRVLP